MTAANAPDASVFEALLDDLPKVRTPAGRWRCRPGKVHADKAYDRRRGRGGGTFDRLAGRVPAAADPLRAGLRAVLRLRHAGLRSPVLQPAALHRRGAHAVTLTKVRFADGGALGRGRAACQAGDQMFCS